MSQTLGRKNRFFFIAFTVSGFTGLVYESIWTHYLKLFLGHAAYAQTLVLATFMAGLAIGSWLIARWSERFSAPFTVYAIIEGLIGVFALVFDAEYNAATRFTFDTLIPLLSNPAQVQMAKWVIGVMLLLPQAVLLGATFPLISTGVVRSSPSNSGEVVALLYFTNSLGAAIGVLVSGFVLISAAGLPGTILIAGALNLLLAAAVWFAAPRVSPPPLTVRAPETTVGTLVAAWIVIIGAVTGAASFLYEIGWIRMLSLVLGSATHSFELMLSAFIFGLAIGGLIVRRFSDARERVTRSLAIVMIAIGFLALATIPLYNYTFDFMAGALRLFARSDAGYIGFLVAGAAVCIGVMLPATICSGMTLPLLTQYLLHAGSGERAFGVFYAANTVGAIVGVIVGVHLLMPTVGVKGLIMVGASAHVFLGIVLLRSWLPRERRFLAAVTASLCFAIVVATGLFAKIDPLRVTSGVYRTAEARRSPDVSIPYLRDGKTATISLLRQGDLVSVATNGKPDALINMGKGAPAADEITMTLAGVIPLFLHPHPARVANIGIGSGLTSHVLLSSRRVEELTSIEIEPFIVEAARRGFMPKVRNLFQDPRSKIVIEDAKSFFAAQRQKFDVIVSEPSNPWVSGVASLFSEEFYARVGAYLNDDGLFVQWVQVYETDITILASIAKGLARHFDDYAMFNTDDANVLIVAKYKGQLPRLSATDGEDEKFHEELKRIGIVDVEQLRAHQLGSKGTLGALFATVAVPRNSDFFPYVDLHAPKMRFLQRNALELIEQRLLPIPLMELLSPSLQTQAARSGTETTYTAIDVATSRANRILDAIRTRSMSDLPPPVVRGLLALDWPESMCADQGVRAAWLDTVIDLAGQTTPFLSPQQVQALWIKVFSAGCKRRLTDSESQYLAFFHSLADRNTVAIAANGTKLLKLYSKGETDEHLAPILAATAASLIADGKCPQANELLSAYAAPIRDARYQFALRGLRGLCVDQSARR